ncbi:hypothetical protein G3580_05475 [Nitrogeniibacter mangrovi]|uniref:Uncharacterized protein n=1 Tax=Nitrogeniibacter mangrovi TaxID=2016596 RepID=A0A6C1B0J8_9RHOO|nr:hypothetical protein G3580_05475 [Nitrogeniibacter mangrovi]
MSEENKQANAVEPETADIVTDAPAAGPASEAGAPRPATDEAVPARKSGKLVPALLVLCLGGLGFLGWQWWQIRGQLAGAQTQVAERLARSDDVAREARAGVHQVQDTVTSIQGKVGLLEAKMAESEGQAAALEDLYQEFSRTRDERMMAEIEQAVTIASQQLQLAGNVEAALIALQGADARLATSTQGRLGPLRRALSHDIERLRATPRVDVTGITLKLEHLLEVADHLPLTFTDQPEANAPAEAQPKGRFLDDPLGYAKALALDVWGEIRAMVRVERLDAAADPVLLSPSQSTFLRENLKIRLLTARLALLGRDARTFEADVSRAAEWVSRYFDLSKPEVKNALETLKQLKTISVAPQQPMLTETLAVLQNMQGRPPIAPVVPIEPHDGAGKGAADAAPASAASAPTADGEPATAAEAPPTVRARRRPLRTKRSNSSCVDCSGSLPCSPSPSAWPCWQASTTATPCWCCRPIAPRCRSISSCWPSWRWCWPCTSWSVLSPGRCACRARWWPIATGAAASAPPSRCAMRCVCSSKGATRRPSRWRANRGAPGIRVASRRWWRRAPRMPCATISAIASGSAMPPNVTTRSSPRAS